MKTIFTTVLLSIALAAPANCEEPVKPKVAVVNLNAMMNVGNFHQRIALLSLDKDTLAAVKKIVVELKAVQQKLVDSQDQEDLNELQRKQQFLGHKLSVITQRSPNRGARRDIQAVLREFVIATYKDKYSLIMQSETVGFDPIVWKGGVEIVDVTEDAMAKLRERLDEISGGQVDNVY
jgi:hypothetical protein